MKREVVTAVMSDGRAEGGREGKEGGRERRGGGKEERELGRSRDIEVGTVG